MALPDPGAYRNALQRSRSLVLEFRQDEARRIHAAIRQFADGVSSEIASLPEGAPLREVLSRVREVNEAAAQRMLNRIVSDAEVGRASLFEQTLEVWEESGLEAARSVGIDAATLGATRPPPATLLGAYESIGAAQNWRTLIRGHVSNAASEANQIVRLGMQEGLARDELARRLRRYVVGSEQFDELFEEVPTLTGDVKKLDLRKIPAHLRDQARQVEFNARRIASSELRNASHEAQVQHMRRDPLIVGIKWELAPTHSDTDECDVLAEGDFYGLGPGVYPVDQVPAPPHPFDSCSNRSIARDSSKIGEEKPSPERQRRGDQVSVSGMGSMTSSRADRIRERAEEALRRGEEALADLRSAA